MSQKVCFIGNSHLSIVSAIAAESKGCEVTVVDMDFEPKNLDFSGNLALAETGVVEKLEESKIFFTNNLEVLSNMPLVYFSLDVKVDEKGFSEVDKIQRYLDTILDSIHENTILVIMSQVDPGFTEKIQHRHKNTYYQMETLVFGIALFRALNQERIVLGCPNSEKPIADALDKYLNLFNCPIIKMSIREAEFTKQAANYFLASTVTATNSLSEYCEAQGLNWENIQKALKFDKRIGENAYLNPGLGLGGTNLIRDLRNIVQNMELLGVNSTYTNDLIRLSDYYRDWILRKIIKVQSKTQRKKIAILGLSYKAGISVPQGSAGFEILGQLKESFTFFVHDKALNQIYKHSNIHYFYDPKNLLETVNDDYILIINTPEIDYKKIQWAEILKPNKNVAILDPYGFLERNQIPESIRYFSLGNGQEY